MVLLIYYDPKIDSYHNAVECTVFEQENFYYYCEVLDGTVEQELDDYEAEAEFVLRFVDINEAIAVNEAYISEDFFNEIMIKGKNGCWK